MDRQLVQLLLIVIPAFVQGASSSSLAFCQAPSAPLRTSIRSCCSSRPPLIPGNLPHCALLTRSGRAVLRMSSTESTANAAEIHSLNEQLWAAAADGNLPLIKALVEQGAAVNSAQPDYDEDEEPTSPDPEDKHVRRPGYTALHMSALMGEAEAIHLLVKLGADVDAKTEGGSTPLHVAAINGRAGAVQALYDEKADLYAENEFGRTPLMMAKMYWRHKKTIKLLKELCGEDTDGPEWTDTAITGC